MLGVQAQKVLVRGLSVSSPAMERDLVNFPQRTRPIEKAPVRMLIFPEEWFTALYSKTGVTGPYMFLAGMGTFLCSKEYFVMEHDFYVGIALACVLTGIVKQVSLSHSFTLGRQHDCLVPGRPRLDGNDQQGAGRGGGGAEVHQTERDRLLQECHRCRGGGSS